MLFLFGLVLLSLFFQATATKFENLENRFRLAAENARGQLALDAARDAGQAEQRTRR